MRLSGSNQGFSRLKQKIAAKALLNMASSRGTPNMRTFSVTDLNTGSSNPSGFSIEFTYNLLKINSPLAVTSSEMAIMSFMV